MLDTVLACTVRHTVIYWRLIPCTEGKQINWC